MGTVAIVSGGMDSVTLLYHLKKLGHTVHGLSFDYGQRHAKEIPFAALHCSKLNFPHDVIDLSGITRFLRGSALTDMVQVPHGHYAEENMKQTIVPNRNAVMLSIAFAVAGGLQKDTVSYAAHGGDHFIYPDCRPSFIEAFAAMENEVFLDDGHIRLFTPFSWLPKAEICSTGADLGVDYEQTWSCYEGGSAHCGACGTCIERREAFLLAGVIDPTEYQATPPIPAAP